MGWFGCRIFVGGMGWDRVGMILILSALSRFIYLYTGSVEADLFPDRCVEFSGRVMLVCYLVSANSLAYASRLCV